MRYKKVVDKIVTLTTLRPKPRLKALWVYNMVSIVAFSMIFANKGLFQTNRVCWQRGKVSLVKLESTSEINLNLFD